MKLGHPNINNYCCICEEPSDPKFDWICNIDHYCKKCVRNCVLCKKLCCWSHMYDDINRYDIECDWCIKKGKKCNCIEKNILPHSHIDKFKKCEVYVCPSCVILCRGCKNVLIRSENKLCKRCLILSNIKFKDMEIAKDNFEFIANKLLNGTIILINSKRFRICELEFYLYDESHKDEYVHRDPEQKRELCWYFHKFKTGNYKSGTFKGMDLTFGSMNRYCGILIRSILNIKNDKMIEGPCNTVNTILKKYKIESINEFTNNKILSAIQNRRRFIVQHSKNLKKEPIYSGQRVGLSDKFPNFRSRPYRFLIYPKRIKKQKRNLKKINQQ